VVIAGGAVEGGGLGGGGEEEVVAMVLPLVMLGLPYPLPAEVVGVALAVVPALVSLSHGTLSLYVLVLRTFVLL